MPTPSTPDAAGRSSQVRRTASTSSPVGPVPPVDRDDVVDTYTSLPQPPEDETPTIITHGQQGKAFPDSQIGKSLAGRKLGHFELIEPVGVGGMAAVIRARDLDLGRIVALKILPPEMAVDPENITRFKQEARAAAKLDHENVARVYYCGEDQGLQFISFEFVEGENLRALLDRDGPLPIGEAIHYMLQIATGLAHASARGVVHRDIKPSNIIITPQGRAKIVDMGLARNLDPQSSIDGGVTQSGVTLGTFDYISPEQALDPRQADVRSDIYSLGCTFYHLLTGRPVVPDGTAAKKLHHHQFVAPTDPRQLNPTIPDELTAILARMMAKDVTLRYQTAEHLVQHLLNLAAKMNLADGVITEPTGPVIFIDAALPQPPRLSPFVIGLMAVACVVGLLVVSGAFNGSRTDTLEPPPLWATNPLAQPLVVDVTPMPATPPDLSPKTSMMPMRNAATTSELLALLQQGAPRILLTGRTYDLTRPVMEGESIPAALFEGRDLVLDAADKLRPPVVRIAYAPIENGSAPRRGSLTLRAPAGATSSSITLHGVRFELVAPLDSRPPIGDLAGISIYGVDQMKIEECAFTSDIPQVVDGAAIAIAQRPTIGAAEILPRDVARIIFNRCYFGRIASAIQLTGRMPPLLARDCAFAPTQSAFRLRGEVVGTDPSVLRIERCTSLLGNACMFDISNRFPAWIESGHNLFCSLNPLVEQALPAPLEVTKKLPRPVLIRASGSLDGLRYQGLLRDEVKWPNGYAQIGVLEWNGQSLNFEQCQAKNVAISDGAAIDLKGVRPLLEEHPEAAFANIDEARAIFRANEKDVRLRVKNSELTGGEAMLGVFNFLGVNNYDLPLAKVEAPPTRVARQKVWQPNYPPNQELPPGVYRDLSAALSEAQSGETVLLRYDQLQSIGSIRLKEGTRVTLRPDKGYRPILSLSTAELSTGMFRVQGGQLTFEDIDFYLNETRATNGQRPSRSIILCTGGGEVDFRHCRFTFVNNQDVDLALVTLSQPDGEMMIPSERPAPPIITLTDCFVHGKGNLMQVRPSRPFQLDLTNSLVALDGSLLRIDSATKETMVAIPSTIRLDRVTTFLSGHLLYLQGSNREDARGSGLQPLQVQATDCLFVPASMSAGAFVKFDPIDSDTLARELLTWKDTQRNWYGYGGTQAIMMQVVPNDVEQMMPPKNLDAKGWLQFTRETGHICRVRFGTIGSDANYQTLRPNQFARPMLDPMPMLTEIETPSGAVLDRLPSGS